jgi:short-subunit dehydrogenase involved in D-alanine esterification of teichoic acids
MAKLDGKIALISGGTSGIDAETAKLFQCEGATVVVTGSSERSVETAKAALPGIEVLVSEAGNVAARRERRHFFPRPFIFFENDSSNLGK